MQCSVLACCLFTGAVRVVLMAPSERASEGRVTLLVSICARLCMATGVAGDLYFTGPLIGKVFSDVFQFSIENSSCLRVAVVAALSVGLVLLKEKRLDAHPLKNSWCARFLQYIPTIALISFYVASNCVDKNHAFANILGRAACKYFSLLANEHAGKRIALMTGNMSEATSLISTMLAIVWTSRYRHAHRAMCSNERMTLSFPRPCDFFDRRKWFVRSRALQYYESITCEVIVSSVQVCMALQHGMLRSFCWRIFYEAQQMMFGRMF